MPLFRLRAVCDICVKCDDRQDALSFTDRIPDEVGGYEFKPDLLKEVESIDDLPPGWVRESIPYGDGPREMLWEFQIRGLNAEAHRDFDGASGCDNLNGKVE